MPGIIQDPRMNDKEKRFGVAKINGVLAAYDKFVHPGLRYLPFGWKLDIDSTEMKEESTVILYWEGNKITTRLASFKSLPDIQQGKVTLKIKKFLESNPPAIFTNEKFKNDDDILVEHEAPTNMDLSEICADTE